MQLFKKILVLALVAAWSLAANHCKLEQLPGLDFLQCVEFVDAAEHSGGDCEKDGCASLESGFYKSENARLAAPLPIGIALVLFCPENLPPVAKNNPALNSASAEIPLSWQFVFRTASPPRAPSFVS